MNATLWLLFAIVGAVGMAGCLFFMLGSKGGEKQLRAFDPHFQSLDMRFHYSAEQALACMNGVGVEGKQLLRRYWLIDYGFIIFFSMVMLAITHNTAHVQIIRYVMYAAVFFRAALDALENTLLLAVLAEAEFKRRKGLASFGGYVTSVKWVCMGVWVLGLFVGLVGSAFKIS